MKTTKVLLFAVAVQLFCVSVTFADAVPVEYTGTENGLIALYHMEDSFETGTFVSAITNVDDTANQRAYVSSGASASVTSMTGFGNALSPQSGSYIYRLGSCDWNNSGSDFTTESWIKWGAGEYDAADVQGILYAGSGSQASGYEWRIYKQNSTIYFYCSDGTNYQAISSGFTPEDDTWYHIAATYEANLDGETSTTKLYITEAGQSEANVVASKDDGLLINTDNNFAMCIGGYTSSYSTSRYLRGDIDEVAIFNYAKTADEFTTLPEPATVALLGLGASMLVRRKKEHKRIPV